MMKLFKLKDTVDALMVSGKLLENKGLNGRYYLETPDGLRLILF